MAATASPATTQAVVYSILNQDPDPLTSVRTGVPMALEWIVSKCLAKKADDRYQSAAELQVDLRTLDLSATGTMSRISGTSAHLGPPDSSSPSGPQTVPIKSDSEPRAWDAQPAAIGALILTTILGFAAAALLLPTGADSKGKPLKRITVELSDVYIAAYANISPDGTFVVIRGQRETAGFKLFRFDFATGITTILEDMGGGLGGPKLSPSG